MRKIRLLIEYDGTDYHGWQIQKDRITIQEILEDRIRKITGAHSGVVGASRTDAGVHAFGQVAAFRTDSDLGADTLKKALNAVLPQNISILDVSETDDSFHPRDHAVKKSYFYIIANQRKAPVFFYRYSWVVPQRLDPCAIEKAAATLVGAHDFSSFMGSGSDVVSTVRQVYSLDISTPEKIDFMSSGVRGNFIKIRIEADGFLRHMVRNIVGTLVETGRGRISADEMQAILVSRDRRRAGQTAPANGLFLEKIFY